MIDAALAGLSVAAVRYVATVDLKASEPGIVEAAAARGWHVIGYPAADLGRGRGAQPVRARPGEDRHAQRGGGGGAAGGGELVVPKQKSAMATVAVASITARTPMSLVTGAHTTMDRTMTTPTDTLTSRPVNTTEDTPIDLGHHGDAEATPGLVDLAVNVRAGAPPAWLANRLVASLTELAAYPRPEVARAAVAARHGRQPDEVLLTAGAAEAFVLLARVLRPRRAVVVHPQFTEPEAALRAAGHPVERLILDGDFRLDPARVPEDADLVVIGNPTNPTSVLHPAATLAALARPGRVLLVDEAFADTVPGEPESLAGRRDLPGLVVVRSLTKTWGLAGLRVGYLLAAPALVDQFAAAQPLWAVSTPGAGGRRGVRGAGRGRDRRGVRPRARGRPRPPAVPPGGAAAGHRGRRADLVVRAGQRRGGPAGAGGAADPRLRRAARRHVPRPGRGLAAGRGPGPGHHRRVRRRAA